jgi:hypothetical protein
MEQQLNATYLKPGVMERAAAIGIAAAGIGTGVLLAAWGISSLWRYTPPEIAVRVANPEIRVTQDKPLTVASPPPIKIDPDVPTLKIERSSPSPGNGLGTDRKTSEGDVIRREVTVFSTVKHGTGYVTTGWNYRDGSGGVPVRQYCYYSAPNIDSSITRINIASDGTRLPNASSLVPELEGALAKCQWWQG